jgi:hypothetical protein
VIEQVHEAEYAGGAEQGCPPGQGGQPAQAVVAVRAATISSSHEQYETG